MHTNPDPTNCRPDFPTRLFNFGFFLCPYNKSDVDLKSGNLILGLSHGRSYMENILIFAHQRSFLDVFFLVTRDFVFEQYIVQRPTFMQPRHFLFHRRQEPLRVEETGHPKVRRFLSEHPRADLSVTQKQFVKPKAYCRRRPRDLQPVQRYTAVVQ